MRNLFDVRLCCRVRFFQVIEAIYYKYCRVKITFDPTIFITSIIFQFYPIGLLKLLLKDSCIRCAVFFAWGSIAFSPLPSSHETLTPIIGLLFNTLSQSLTYQLLLVVIKSKINKFVSYTLNRFVFIADSNYRTENENEYLRLCAYFQAITKMKKKKRQPKMLVCRLLSEWGDSNARPLRPERSALPTALHSVPFGNAKV